MDAKLPHVFGEHGNVSCTVRESGEKVQRMMKTHSLIRILHGDLTSGVEEIVPRNIYI